MIDLKIEATLAARNQGAKSLQQRRDRGRIYVDIEVSSNALLKGKKKLITRLSKARGIMFVMEYSGWADVECPFRGDSSENFASEQLADVIAREASARTGKYISGSNNYLEHLEDWKTTLDSSEQTKSYADRRRSGSEVPSEKACPFEGFTMEGSNLFPL
ncbi:hypothetical protein OSB04_031648 [Centaurea solstitialis]|uniref:Uncharacterized protein n=1 Tax=Centaurea solstitialis TaxID=347529 RepID=A0AA38SMJ1_9ASTR|nr:hypothetical protein OSB04_031648 [Centaurea solstitialis]